MTDNKGNDIKKIRKSTVSGDMWGQLGKLPPQSVETEIAILGAILLEKEAIYVAAEVLDVDSFYKDEHKEIYSAILNLMYKNSPIDILTVVDELRKLGKLEFTGGPFYVDGLTNNVGGAGNLEYHCRIVEQKSLMRKIIGISSYLQTEAFEEQTDVFDLMTRAQDDFFKLATLKGVKTTKNMREVGEEVKAFVKNATFNPESLGIVKTGFKALDKFIGGFIPGQFTIIGARPGMGKTAFMTALSKNIANSGKRVAIFSLEMTTLQLGFRLVAEELNVARIDPMPFITVDRLTRGDISVGEYERIIPAVSKFQDLGIFIDDEAAQTTLNIKNKMRKLLKDYGIDIAFIDYLQLMTGIKRGGNNNINREQEIASISRDLKQMSKDFNIPLVAFSQLTRDVEKRGGQKRPALSDLRESGALEQDTDQVIFIHRPEYYGVTEDEHGNSIIGMTEIIIAKQRQGPLGDIRLKFLRKYASFTDWDGELAPGVTAAQSELPLNDIPLDEIPF